MTNDLNQFSEEVNYYRNDSQSLYLQLTNNRDAVINDQENKMTVLLGYYKIMNMINRRLVRAESAKRVSVK